jgi:hypothetical protein
MASVNRRSSFFRVAFLFGAQPADSWRTQPSPLCRTSPHPFVANRNAYPKLARAQLLPLAHRHIVNKPRICLQENKKRTSCYTPSGQPRATLREVPLSPRSGAAHMDESRKRVLGIMAAILAARKLVQYESGPRVPATIMAIGDAVRWAEQIMQAIDERWPVQPRP